MRTLLRSFAFLDIISLVFLAMQLWYIVFHFEEACSQLTGKIESILMFPMFVLIAFGAYGLFFAKKFGFILYYIQFVPRLYLWIFSVGFITLLPEALSFYDDKWFGILLKICFMVEFIRLYLTIKAHIRYRY